MISLRLAALVVAALLSPSTLHAAEPLGQVPGLVREATSVPFAPHGGAPLLLDALVTRPAGAGRFPLVVLSHGTPRDPADRAKTTASSTSAVAIEFARRGWAVVAVVRRGYGHSQGTYVESSGSCGHRNYRAAAHASAEDIGETVKFMARQPYVDPGRVMLAGVSAGGFASIAAAAQPPPGIVAVLNFAGGRGSDAPDSVCDADALVAAFGELGRTVRVPTLWFYAENDHFFGPTLAQRFFASFTAAGGAGTFVKLPAFGADGHMLLSQEGVALWRARVDTFLRQQNLPTWSKPVVEVAADVPPPRSLSASGRESFARYLASGSFEKAFAAGATRGYGWASGRRSTAEAKHEALETCTKNAPDCTVYAVNNARAR